MSVQQAQPEDVDIDIRGLVQEVWQKKIFITVIAGVTGIALFVFFSAMSPKYISDARILIENRETVFTQAANQPARSELFDKEAIGSQVEVLNSDTITLAVIKKLGLAKRDEYSSIGKTSIVSDVLIAFGLSKRKAPISPEAKILEKFQDGLTVYAVDGSRVIVVEFSSKDPLLAQAVPNAMASEFLKLQKEASLTATLDATQWLGPEIEKLRERVRTAEAAVASYRANSDILLGNNNALLATQQLSEISTELTRLRAERAVAAARVASMRKALKKGSSLESVPEVANSAIVQRLRENKLALHAQISELSTSLLPNHPRLKALQSQHADFDRQINIAAKTILTGMEDNVGFTKEKETELRAEMNRLKSESSRVSVAEVDLRALEREATAERELLQSYLGRYQEAASRQSNKFVPVNARTISEANLPVKPYFPKIFPYSLAGAIAAFILTIVGILAAALIDGRAFKKLGASPQLQVADSETKKEPLERPGVYSEGNVMEVLCRLGRGRLVLMSGDQKQLPSISWRFARKLALQGRRVALVDLSLEQGACLAMLGRNDLLGIGDVMRGSVRLTQVFYNDRSSPVQIVPAGTGLLHSGPDGVEQLSELVDGLSQNYDFVVVDCGGTSADGIHPVARADTIIVVDSTGDDSGSCKVLDEELSKRGYQEVVMMKSDEQPLQAPLPRAA